MGIPKRFGPRMRSMELRHRTAQVSFRPLILNAVDEFARESDLSRSELLNTWAEEKLDALGLLGERIPVSKSG